jgi:hypothetical protein
MTTANVIEGRCRRHHAEKCECDGNVFPVDDCDVCSKAVTMWAFHARDVSWLLD